MNTNAIWNEPLTSTPPNDNWTNLLLFLAEDLPNAGEELQPHPLGQVGVHVAELRHGWQELPRRHLLDTLHKFGLEGEGNR